MRRILAGLALSAAISSCFAQKIPVPAVKATVNNSTTVALDPVGWNAATDSLLKAVQIKTAYSLDTMRKRYDAQIALINKQLNDSFNLLPLTVFDKPARDSANKKLFRLTYTPIVGTQQVYTSEDGKKYSLLLSGYTLSTRGSLEFVEAQPFQPFLTYAQKPKAK